MAKHGPHKVIKVGSQSRVAQACDRCRVQRRRCNGIRPCCNTCSEVGLECKTSDNLSRQAFPKGYTGMLEDQVRSLEAEVRDLKGKSADMQDHARVDAEVHNKESSKVCCTLNEAGLSGSNALWTPAEYEYNLMQTPYPWASEPSQAYSSSQVGLQSSMYRVPGFSEAFVVHSPCTPVSAAGHLYVVDTQSQPIFPPHWASWAPFSDSLLPLPQYLNSTPQYTSDPIAAEGAKIDQATTPPQCDGRRQDYTSDSSDLLHGSADAITDAISRAASERIRLPKLEYPTSDTDEEALYNPVAPTAPVFPTQPSTPNKYEGQQVFPRNNMSTERLLAADQVNISARSASPAMTTISEKSPLRPDSQYAGETCPDSAGSMARLGLAAQVQELNAAATGIAKTLSPKEEYELEHESDTQNASMSPMPHSAQAPHPSRLKQEFMQSEQRADDATESFTESSKNEPQSGHLSPSPQSRSLELVHSPYSIADIGTYTCTYQGCTERFNTTAKLTQHKRDGHHQHIANSARGDNRVTQAGPHRCERINPSTGKPCKSVFNRPYDLTRHENTIHNARKEKFKCQLCTEEKSFSRNDGLTRHMRVVHLEVDFPGKTKRGQT